MARPAGIEPATFGLGGRRSILLSQGRKMVGTIDALKLIRLVTALTSFATHNFWLVSLLRNHHANKPRTR